MKKVTILKILTTAGIFWILDFFLHFTGVGETNYYYTIKLANSLLFSFIWFAIFNYEEHWKKMFFSIIFGTWISFFYLVSSYSGIAQFFGVYARYSPPAFMIFGKSFSPFLWWIFHSFVFYIGLETSNYIGERK